MIPQRWIEAYLRFLLRYRGSVVIVVTVMTAFFGGLSHIRLNINFFDFYPRQHPYIKFYNEFRKMFGTANIINVILEVKKGDYIATVRTILVVVPAFIKVLRPGFLLNRRPKAVALEHRAAVAS